MVYVVTGAGGQVGREVVDRLQAQKLPFRAFDKAGLDIADTASVHRALGSDVSVLINCAAYTAVDAAETDREGAWRVNAIGPSVLAKLCADAGVRLVHVSTDYVFDGRGHEPYAETDDVAPQTVYGESKLAGERAVQIAHPDGSYVMRTAWVYGEHGSNFVKTMLNLAATRETVSVVTDQVGQPTWAGDIADALLALAAADADVVKPGVYHYTSAGACSWFEFAQEIFRLAGLDVARVLPTTSAEFVRPAQRPAHSVLSHDKWLAAGLPAMREWREALVASGVIAAN